MVASCAPVLTEGSETGHFHPLIPFARACAAAGHAFAVAAPARFAEAVSGAGFVHLPFDEPTRDVIVNAGIELPGGLQAVAELPDALRRLLDDPSYAAGAPIAAEIAALPDVSESPPLLKQLAAERSKGVDEPRWTASWRDPIRPQRLHESLSILRIDADILRS